MKTNVISSEYLMFQEAISDLTQRELQSLSGKEVINQEGATIKDYPLLPHLELHIHVKDYSAVMDQLSKIIVENKSDSAQDIDKIKSLLTNEILERWVREAVAVNSYYFADYAKEHGLPEWLPLFLAENALRPFIQKAAQEVSEQIPKKAHKGSCPVCGEPPRLAVLNKIGKKEVTCSRCHFAWEEKKISCAHCGTEEPGQVVVIRVEEDDSAEIYACKSCNGYTKVIDTRKLLKVATPELLDLKSIHLDYMAQENGYGYGEEEEEASH
ncbi:formate dehydrogenase accessory protein FdhE [Niallia sp. XMNu-256]|uniref:formate dehydrogenase accessory protein FdhE n=1 Tax=Niallia sp. XMNu-256 TaxID=3082444 RepID=UPI0030CEB842